MTKEEYLLEKQSIEEQMSALREKYHDLKNKYVQANYPFGINERVEVVRCRHPYWSFGIKTNEPTGYNEESRRFAYVVKYTVNSKGDIEPILRKENKDGTMSKYPDYFNRFDTINKI